VHRARSHRDSQQIGVDGTLLVAQGDMGGASRGERVRRPNGTLVARAPPVKTGTAECTPRAVARDPSAARASLLVVLRDG
jgi:hypothetical protein